MPWNRRAFDSITTVSSPQWRGTAGLLIPLPQYHPRSAVEPRGFWFHYHSIIPAVVPTVPWNRGAFDSITTVSSPQWRGAVRGRGTVGLLIPLPHYRPRSAVEPPGFDSITTVSSPQYHGTAGLLIPLLQYHPRSAVEPRGFWFHYLSIIPAVPWNRGAFDSITTVSSPQWRGAAGLLIPLPQYRPRSGVEPRGFWFHYHSIIPAVPWNCGAFDSITTVSSPQCRGTAGLLIPLPQYCPRSTMEPRGFWFHYCSIIPAVPWNSGAFDSIT